MEGHLATNSVKLIADKHAKVLSKLRDTEQELAEKKEHLKLLENETSFSEGSLRLVEDNLRGINGKYFHAQNSLIEKERFHEELVKELVEVQWRTQVAQDKYNVLETKYVDFQVDKAVRIDQLNCIEERNCNLDNGEGDEGEETKREELEKIKTLVDQYREYKELLDVNDSHVVRILNGDTFVELETRKTGIRDAFARREARVEGIYVEIDEKNEAVNSLKQTLLIKEKQNQAKLRRLQRELQDKEETEKHLKQTVEYLDRQIDPALLTHNRNQASSNMSSYTRKFH